MTEKESGILSRNTFLYRRVHDQARGHVHSLSSLASQGDLLYTLMAIPDHPSFVTGDWYEQLYPLTVTLKDCIGEVVTRARQSMSFVLLQELACSLPQCLMLTLRRDIVFSQAVGASSIL